MEKSSPPAAQFFSELCDKCKSPLPPYFHFQGMVSVDPFLTVTKISEGRERTGISLWANREDPTAVIASNK